MESKKITVSLRDSGDRITIYEGGDVEVINRSSMDINNKLYEYFVVAIEEQPGGSSKIFHYDVGNFKENFTETRIMDSLSAEDIIRTFIDILKGADRNTMVTIHPFIIEYILDLSARCLLKSQYKPNSFFQNDLMYLFNGTKESIPDRLKVNGFSRFHDLVKNYYK